MGSGPGSYIAVLCLLPGGGSRTNQLGTNGHGPDCHGGSVLAPAPGFVIDADSPSIGQNDQVRIAMMIRVSFLASRHTGSYDLVGYFFTGGTGHAHRAFGVL